MKKIIIWLIPIFCLATLLMGCNFDSSSPDTPGTSVGIRGIIRSIEVTGNGAAILVEGKIEEDTQFDKALVRIDSTTMIQKDNLSRLFQVPDLKVGDRVEVIFKGPIAESYPVQGKAEIVRIISQ